LGSELRESRSSRVRIIHASQPPRLRDGYSSTPPSRNHGKRWSKRFCGIGVWPGSRFPYGRIQIQANIASSPQVVCYLTCPSTGNDRFDGVRYSLTTPYDAAFSYDGSSARRYLDKFADASYTNHRLDGAVPLVKATAQGTLATTTNFGAVIFVNTDNSESACVLDGAFTVSIDAIS